MIEVIYREDVSEKTIHEPRNVTQVGSVDPKYRIYMEDAVLTCIRKMNGTENEVHYGLLLGELKRAAGTTYLFIRGTVKAAVKDTGKEEPERKDRKNERKKDGRDDATGTAGADRGKETIAEADRGKARDHRTGSCAVAMERLTQDRQRMRETEYLTQDGQRMKETEHLMKERPRTEEIAEKWLNPETQSAELETEVPELAESDAEKKSTHPAIEFDGDTWTRLYEDINHYFPDMEILGWYASLPFLNVAGFDLCRQTHYTHFSGADKVLFLCDRTEREENFYRPDGLELRETEGYFTFFEKNDAMQVYCQETEPAKEADDVAGAGDGRRSEIRQGTVGEAPRKKWNISAASILVTAALLAAVLIVNRYNGRLRSEGMDPADGTAKEETSTLQALAVDGQVMESGTEEGGADDGDKTGDGTANGGTNGNGAATGDGDTDGNETVTGDGADDGNTDGNETVTGDGADDGNTNGNGTLTGDGADDGNKTGSGADDGDTNGNGTLTGDGADDGNTDGNETVTGDGADDGDTNGNGTVTGDGADDGNITGDGSTAGEDETVQTGSRVSARYYTVKNGETLYSICMDVYKTSAMVEIVRVLNGIGEDFAIQAGQKILLP